VYGGALEVDQNEECKFQKWTGRWEANFGFRSESGGQALKWTGKMEGSFRRGSESRGQLLKTNKLIGFKTCPL